MPSSENHSTQSEPDQSPEQPGQYIAEAGDCISSIAFEHGFFWQTVWDHSDNAQLKSQRKNPNVLLEGDIVHIPKLTLKDQSGSAGQRHSFKLKGVPATLRLRIVQSPKPASSEEPGNDQDEPQTEEDEKPAPSTAPQDEPHADIPYTLEIEGTLIKGTTNSDGMIECSIPPNAKEGKLILEPGTLDELVIRLKLGHLDPIGEPSGAQARLSNLGYRCGDPDSDNPNIERALRDFQARHQLKTTGELDQPTRDKLDQVHDSQ
jgi:hypothetical protein